jgi:hypothetical protein
MATAEQYADWIVKNKDKQGTPEFETVAEAYKLARSENAPVEQPQRRSTDVQPERSTIDNIGRQVGLTARAGIEGLSDSGEFVINSANKLGSMTPVGRIAKAATDYAGIPSELNNSGTEVADMVGLPSPENKIERNVNTASRFMVPTGAIVKGANIASKGAPIVKDGIAKTLAARPGMQAAGSIGAGYAGSEAREHGASPLMQFGATVLGGLAAPLGVAAIEGIGKSAIGSVKNLFSTPAAEKIVMNKINQAGINLEALPKDVQKSLVTDVQAAMKTGKDLSPDALRRLADYKQVGATPMGSSLTLKPADITRDRNLAKMSANSKDPAAQQLANLQRDNDIKLISGLNTLGAETADDAMTAGNKLISYLNVKDEATKKVINTYYSQARETTGRSAKLDPSAFTNQANNMLDEALLGGKLPNDVRNILNSIAQGKTPLTVDVAEQYKTAIGTLQRSSTDPAERLALGKVREALDNTPLLDGQGKAAIDAFNKARGAHRTYMNMVDKTPALKAVRDGVEPDKFVNTFILGQGGKANVADVTALRNSLKDNKEAVTTIKGQIAAYLKSQATGGKADEVANFSPSNYAKALKNIGDDKLNLFFTPDDIKMLKAIGRVGSYEKFQPTGSAVNNSNTSAALFTAMLDKVANSAVIRKIPLGGAIIADPAKDVAVAIGSRNALNAPKALTLPKPKVKSTGSVPIGALLGLGTVSENEGN